MKPRGRGVESRLTHIEVGEDDLHVVLRVARNGRVPRRLVELPAGLEGMLDLAASLGLQVGIKLLRRGWRQRATTRPSELERRV